ncbi:DUF1622 domain-containing protein [Leptodesmis sichuanensis]|uniref:DUF1622 domain-containing protein n=1 Tax=Leptodesmis sichuanensis TaxID=2906798 RepID=UPI001F2D2BDD|nr:DUF1622 domain-containing protein [Leptodesmis sichuanensis]UIE38564.1 DUF1622 domain-containing protein [Leptodesmis sichuanensis A121]
MEHLEHSLNFWAGTLKLVLEGISLFCILLGLLTTLQIILIQNRRLRGSPSALANIRLNFGRWLSVALEFQLGADIANTTVAPSFEALGKLGLIAVIRTFLNYFLTRELAEEMKVADQQCHSPSLMQD